jgi:hypothetical protein
MGGDKRGGCPLSLTLSHKGRGNIACEAQSLKTLRTSHYENSQANEKKTQNL